MEKQISIGFSGLLALIFITLKLCNVIAWSWLWVLAPLWIPVAAVLVVLAVVALLVGITVMREKP